VSTPIDPLTSRAKRLLHVSSPSMLVAGAVRRLLPQRDLLPGVVQVVGAASVAARSPPADEADVTDYPQHSRWRCHPDRCNRQFGAYLLHRANFARTLRFAPIRRRAARRIIPGPTYAHVHPQSLLSLQTDFGSRGSGVRISPSRLKTCWSISSVAPDWVGELRQEVDEMAKVLSPCGLL
jgi:hypothetical protein